MSLNKQLWLAILLVITMTALGSLMLTIVSSKKYLEKQLQIKNIDNVTSLALSISQLPKDNTTVGLLLSAQFDAGHYRYIELTDPNGRQLLVRSNNNHSTKAPRWFVRALTINTYPAKAAIQDGWTQYGELTLESNINTAYDELWNATQYTVLFAILLMIASGVLGSVILRKILQPLSKVITQSEAMKNHQFMHVVPPKTPEFKALVNSMNSLTEFVKNNVSQEMTRLKAIIQEVNFDATSGLMSHAYFTKNLDARLARQSYANNGVLIVTRLRNLADINKNLGYTQTNALIKEIGQRIQTHADQIGSKLSGRLSGSDFVIFHENTTEYDKAAQEMKILLEAMNEAHSAFAPIHFMFLTLEIGNNSQVESLYAEVDSLFTQTLAILGEDNIHEHNIIQIKQNDQSLAANQDILCAHLTEALQQERLQLALFPVLTCDGTLIHYECPMRLQLHGEWLNAGKFINTATKLNLLDQIDLLVLKQALHLLQSHRQPLSLNVSAASILSAYYVRHASQLLAAHRDIASNICFEIVEEDAFKHLNAFRAFCTQVQAYDCKVALEHVGLEVARLGELHDIGLDFIKIDQSIIRGIHLEEANQTLLSGLCIIAHGIGVRAIAEGVKTADEMKALQRLGIDGMTGPAIVEKT